MSVAGDIVKEIVGIMAMIEASQGGPKMQKLNKYASEDVGGPSFSLKQQNRGRVSIWESAKPFVFGGLAGMLATSIIQPMDFFKVIFPIDLSKCGITANHLLLCVEAGLSCERIWIFCETVLWEL